MRSEKKEWVGVHLSEEELIEEKVDSSTKRKSQPVVSRKKKYVILSIGVIFLSGFVYALSRLQSVQALFNNTKFFSNYLIVCKKYNFIKLCFLLLIFINYCIIMLYKI